ncbi:MAG: serine hydrolase domain-containing protein, partial [bacterium]
MDIARAAALVDERMAQARAEYDIPAIAYGLVLGGELVHAGEAAVEGGRPPTSSSAFRIASMTKSFTAATVLALRDRGLLALDDPVGTWLPWAAERLGQPPAAPQPTVRHLLVKEPKT